MKKNYESITEIYDGNTGEVKYSKRKFVKNYEEKFFMIRVTEGMGWTRRITGINEFRLALFMASNADIETGEIPLNNGLRKKACEELGLEMRSVCNIISKLISHGLIKRTGHALYIVNPRYFYKGSMSNVKKRINSYDAA